MPFLLRANPGTLKLPPPPHQFSPFSPFGKHATFTVTFSDASNPPAGQATPPNHLPPIVVCPFKRTRLLTAGSRPLPLLPQLRPVCDVGTDTENSSTANPDTVSNSTTAHFSPAPTACFPSPLFPVLGPFDLLHCIQKGGFGTAWAARDQSTGRLLCLKMFQSLRDPDVTRSVRMELGMFRRMVKSKGGERGKQFIIELIRSIQHSTTVFFAMELMTIDLGTYLSTEPERCKAHARRWLAQIALGIESLHEMGILHRDIKSENILIDSRENVRIIDFGLSYLDSCVPLCRGVGYSSDFLGTPPYMAPEVLRNKRMPLHRRRCYGTAVDWWGLGCILFELESQDHQPLFYTEEDVHAYVAWTQRPDDLDQIYSKFEGLEPLVLNLLDGLLQVPPAIRYCLEDLEMHDYFQHHDLNEFDSTGARALERPVRPELVPQFAGHGPVEVVAAATLSSVFDWTNSKWAHTTGDSRQGPCAISSTPSQY